MRKRSEESVSEMVTKTLSQRKKYLYWDLLLQSVSGWFV